MNLYKIKIFLLQKRVKTNCPGPKELSLNHTIYNARPTAQWISLMKRKKKQNEFYMQFHLNILQEDSYLQANTKADSLKHLILDSLAVFVCKYAVYYCIYIKLLK